MKRVKVLLSLVLAVLILSPSVANAASFSYTFIGAAPTEVNSIDTNNSIASGYPNGQTIDSQGNIYTVGDFAGEVDFNPNGTASTLTSLADDSLGYKNGFITMTNSEGEFVWAKGFLGTANTIVRSINISSTNEIYVTGNFNGVVDLNPGSGTDSHDSSGSTYGYIVKLDQNGTFIESWVTPSVSFESINIAADGSIYLGGYFFGTSIDVDPSVGTETLSSISPSFTDALLVKMNSSMEYQWNKTWGAGNMGVRVTKLQTQGNDLYLAGTISSSGTTLRTVDFDPGVGVDSRSFLRSNRAYIAKYNLSGDYQWVRTFGDQVARSSDSINGFAVSEDGVYFSGTFAGTSDFNDAGGTDNHTQGGGGAYYQGDHYLTKYNLDGTYGYTKSWYGLGERSYIAVDGYGILYLLSGYSGTDDIDPGAGTVNLTSTGASGVYLARFNENDGTYIDHMTFDGDGDESTGHLVYKNEELALSIFNSTYELDLDPTAGTSNYTFGAKLSTAIIKLGLNYRFSGTPGSGLTAKTVAADENTASGTARSSSKLIRLFNASGVPIVQFSASMTADRDWSSITAASDASSYKAVSSGVASAPGVVGTHSLFVPKRTGDNAVYICPNATELSEVSATCQNVITYKQGDANVQVVSIEGKEYWLVSGLTGTGGMSTSVTTTLASTGTNSSIVALVSAFLVLGGGVLLRRAYAPAKNR